MARKETVVEFSPGTGPYDTPTWVELTGGGPHGNRLRSADWAWGRSADDDDFPAGTATIVLTNHDRLFDPENTAGDYSGDLTPRVPFRITTSDGDDEFYGFVDSGWEQTYQHPEDGYCTVELVDMLGVIEGYTLPGVLETAVMALDPVGYWPLTDPAAQDLTGRNHGTLVEDPQAGAPDLFPGVGSSFEFDGEFERVDITRSPIGTFVDTWHCSVVALFSTAIPAEVASSHPIIVSLDGNVAQSSNLMHLYVDLDGTIAFDYIQGGAGFALASTVAADDGKPHVVFAQSNAGEAFGYGIGIDTATLEELNGGGPALQGGNGVAIGGTPGAARGYDDNYFPGRIGHVAIYDAVLDEPDRQSILDAVDCLTGLRSDEHVDWVLDQVGVPAGLRSLDEGRSIMGPARTAGENALGYLRKIARTEQGALYVDHHDGGKIRFVERYAPWFAARSTAVQAVFSDDPANTTAVRVEPGSLVVESNGIETVINQATVRWVGGEETAEDSPSVAAYGPRGRSIDTVAGNPNQALSLAQWVSALQSQPAARVRGFGINPAAAEDGFPASVDLRPFDLVTFRSQPAATGTAVTRNLLIQGGRHWVEGLSRESTFFTSQTPDDLLSLFILGTSLLDGTDALAY